MPNDSNVIAVVGGGAAGLAAAIFAGQSLGVAARDHRIVVLDGADRLGAKILVAGGGRCNVTHHHVTSDDFNGPRTVIRNVLRAFDADAAVAWFAAMGVELKREPTGKLFPVTDSARTVLDALIARCQQLHVDIRTSHRVRTITPNPDGGFDLTHDLGRLHARCVVMATGGRSLPRTGSDGGAYSLLGKLGHTATDTHAALVPLVLDSGFFHAKLSGISHEVELITTVGGKRMDVRTGSLLWTHFGISGPVVMDASRHWVIADAQGQQPMMCVNCLPGHTFDQVNALLQPEGDTGRTLGQRLTGMLPKRMADILVEHVQLTNATAMNQLPRDARRRLAHALTALPLPILKHRGWNYAEVTAGGVPLNEVDFRTMGSRKQPGLYLVGEVLDVDGRIGGFNFQWAWATGHIAGHATAKAILSGA